MNDHADIYAAEAAALAPTDWEHWIERVETLIGHDADGNIREDGYSLGTFDDMFRAGLSPEVASTRILGALYVTAVGATYRLTSVGARLGGTYGEQYNVLTETGSLSLVYELPAGATLVWAPDRGVTRYGICANCGRGDSSTWLTTDEWRASGLCGMCLNGYAPRQGATR